MRSIVIVVSLLLATAACVVGLAENTHQSNEALLSDGGPYTKDNFQAVVVEELCKKLANCCFGDENLSADASVDGGHYNQTRCLDMYRAASLEESAPGPKASFGRISFDESQAESCISAIRSLSCTTTGAEYQAARAACYGATVGVQATNDPCHVSAECSPGHYCNALDGGGSCVALRDVDASCGDLVGDPTAGQQLCSYRYSGDPARYCESYDFGTSHTILAANRKCKVAGANGARCTTNEWCASGLCDFDTGTCVASVNEYPSYACDYFRSP